MFVESARGPASSRRWW